MEPTMIKTQTTKTAHEAQHDDIGYISIGGRKFRAHCWDGVIDVKGFDDHGCKSQCHLNQDDDLDGVKITVTDTREMTVMDLQVGDAFVVPEDINLDAVCICIEEYEGEYVRALCLHNNRVRTVRLKRRDDPITLVDVEFEAEPVDEERTVPVGTISIGTDFRLGGQRGVMRGHHRCCEYCYAKWPEHDNKHLIPSATTVTVREPGSFESWEYVRVGDVAMYRDEHACIYMGSDRWHCPSHKVPINAPIHRFTTARLTSVTWTPKTEITR